MTPRFGLGEAFEEGKALAEETTDVGDEDEAGYEAAEGAEGEGEADFVFEEGALGGGGEVVVVLEGGETALFLGVLEEGGLGIAGDEGVVDLREEELPATPGDSVSQDDVA